MSIHFSRSMRSLNIDSFQASRFGLILGSLLVMVLIAWFLFASGLYAVSQEVGLTRWTLIATFERGNGE
jgi:hypothetical protein